MFLDMANAGLIVIGSSINDSHPDINRNAFLKGKEEILSYFKSIRDGLGIDQNNILDLFNSDDPPHHQQTAIQSFITSKRLDDIFIYITGHGFARNKDLYVFLKRSKHEDANSSLNLTVLLPSLNGFGEYRIFAFIDTCASGSFHTFNSINQTTPVLIGYISSADSSHLPRSGLSVLTSNNYENCGPVLADDNLSPIDSPLFTHELVKLLRKGKRRDQKFGFSMHALRETLEVRIKETLEFTNRRELIVFSRPEVTDLTDFDNASVAVLSDVGIFPNNDPSNALIIKAAKKVRLTHSHIKDLNEQILELQKSLDESDTSSGLKSSEINTLRSEIEELSNKLSDEKSQRRKSQSQKTGFIYATVVLFLVLVISLTVSVTIIRPVGFWQAIESLKKSG